jgi:NAD(P)-dependent dehydrogenase (short-subunit alcohol dehydrogenase family)
MSATSKQAIVTAPNSLGTGATPQIARHALVTGGGTGIGAAIAQALVVQGLNVTVLGRRAEPLNAVVATAPDRLHAVLADVTDPAQLTHATAQATERFGPVAVLVNNAGQAVSAAAHKTSFELWQQMLAVNLTGTWLCTQAVLPAMRKAGWGRVVNVASTAGLVGYAYVSAYCAAKHGVVGLTRSLALEAGHAGHHRQCGVPRLHRYRTGPREHRSHRGHHRPQPRRGAGRTGAQQPTTPPGVANRGGRCRGLAVQPRGQRHHGAVGPGGRWRSDVNDACT